MILLHRLIVFFVGLIVAFLLILLLIRKEDWLGTSHSKWSNPDWNLLLVVVDTLRADHLGCYGNVGVKTPTMDRIAREGVRFSKAFSHIPITGPSHSTLFTSQYASQIPVLNNGQVLPAGQKTIAEYLNEAGWQTGGFVSMAVLDSQFGFDQGFQTYRDEMGPAWQLSAGAVNEACLDWLNEDDRARFFGFVHYCEPHEPYLAHGERETPVQVMMNNESLPGVDISIQPYLVLMVELKPGENVLQLTCSVDMRLRTVQVTASGQALEWRLGETWVPDKAKTYVASQGQIVINNPQSQPLKAEIKLVLSEVLSLETLRRYYQKEVEAVDQSLGILMAEMEKKNLLENTVIILTADHGESLGEHNLVGHIDQLYDPLLHIPMIIRFPNQAGAGTVVEDLAGWIDLMPTILEVLDQPIPAELKGKSLVASIQGKSAGDEKSIYAETFPPEAPQEKRAVRNQSWKYIKTVEPLDHELYNLIDDPGESMNLSEKERGWKETMSEILETYLAAPSNPHSDNPELDEETKEKLRALGYVR